MRRALPATVLTLFAMALLGGGPALAQTIEPPTYGGTTMTGADAVGGPAFSGFPGIKRMDVDQSSGSLYVAHASRIYKFDLATNASAEFDGLAGSTVITGQPVSNTGDVEVDNSGGAGQGTIYAFEEFGSINKYLPSGLAATLGFKTPGGDICGSAIAPDGRIWLNQFSISIAEYDAAGNATGNEVLEGGQGGEACDFEIDSQGNFYVTSYWETPGGIVNKFSPTGEFLYSLGQGTSLAIAIDRSNDNVFVDDGNRVSMYSSQGSLLATFGLPDGDYPGLLSSVGIAVDEQTHKVYVANNRAGANGVDVFVPGPPIIAPDVASVKAVPAPTAASLRGVLNPDGVDVQDCYFEWGLASAGGYEHEVDCAEGTSFTGSDDIPVTASIGGLTKGTEYKFRLVAENVDGIAINGASLVLRAQGEPQIIGQFVNQVKGDGVTLNAEIDPDFGDTTYYFEYGTDTAYGTKVPLTDGRLATSTGVQTVSQVIHGLDLDTEYHYRVVAANDAGTTPGDDRTFRTFPPFTNVDNCPNALARQQTGAILLDHCRAYELVSAANSGGYNVESDLVSGQSPLPGFPEADDKVAYGMHNGGIPGTGNPTNKGVDPYVASRGESGWTTRYVGIPANGTPSTTPFASTLAAADGALTTFAFGSAELCAPCFPDGSSGVPIRLPGGELVQGMRGSIAQVDAEPVGFVAKALSGDGTHLIFGSDKKLEPAGNEGSVSIYDRNLATGATQVVSTLPGSAGTITGVAGELDVSHDGSRIVVGEQTAIDAAGNRYWHPYMHVGSEPGTIDLAPGMTSGAIYAGMSADGGSVFYATKDPLVPEDTDTSADIYVAEVDDAGDDATVELLTTVSSDGCDPAPNADANNWNAVGPGSDDDCGAVAIGGGGGVASEAGTIYFFSPEQLEGEGELNQPNLFMVRPGGEAVLVATFDPDDPIVRNSVADSERRDAADLQISSNGEYAAFSVAAPLTEFDNHGKLEVFRFEASTGDIACASCASSRARPAGDATLAARGLSLLDDGRVFFTTPEPLVLRDTGARKDVYEWTEGDARLISSGSSSNDAGLLTASADGRDVFFFTRDTFVEGDLNGTLMKVYDAREGGGFFDVPEAPPCAASDECHGPGSARPPAPTVGSFAGTPANARSGRCRKGQVRKRGRCVRKQRRVRKQRNKGRKHRSKGRKHGRRSHR